MALIFCTLIPAVTPFYEAYSRLMRSHSHLVDSNNPTVNSVCRTSRGFHVDAGLCSTRRATLLRSKVRWGYFSCKRRRWVVLFFLDRFFVSSSSSLHSTLLVSGRFSFTFRIVGSIPRNLQEIFLSTIEVSIQSSFFYI